MQKLTADEARRAREAVGASQIEMAQAVGINRTYYSLFEGGRYVLDDDEQERLQDALAERGYSAPADMDDPTDALPEDRSEAALGAAASADAAPLERTPLSRAKAALSDIRAALPSGLQSIRVARSVESAAGALTGLDYGDLLQVASGSSIQTDGLISHDEFSELDLDGMQAWESRAAGVLICANLYGDAWAATCFDTLKEAEGDLRAILDGQHIEYRGRGFLDILFGDGNAHCPNRRADLAPYFVRAAIQRRAPRLRTRPATAPTPKGEAA